MLIQIPVTIFLIFSFCLCVLGIVASKSFQQKILFPYVIQYTAYGAFVLDIYITVFSLIFVNKLSFYNPAFQLINSVFASVTALVMLGSFTVFEFFFAVKSSNHCMKVRAEYSLNSLTSKYAAVDKAVEDKVIDSKESKKKISRIQNMLDFYERMLITARYVRKVAFFQLFLWLSDFISLLIERLFINGFNFARAFTCASAVGFVNGIIFVLPLVFLCFAMGVSFTNNTEQKLLRKIATVEKIKEKKKWSKKNVTNGTEENETSKSSSLKLFIELGYGLIYLIQTESGQKLINVIDEIRKENSSFPMVYYIDTKELDFFQYRVSYGEKETGGEFYKHDDDDARLISILDSIIQILQK